MQGKKDYKTHSLLSQAKRSDEMVAMLPTLKKYKLFWEMRLWNQLPKLLYSKINYVTMLEKC